MNFWFTVLLAPLLLASGPAFAGQGALEEARKLTSDATVEYNVGRFDQALDLYTKAYERYPKAALLFDIGQCHRLLGHYERALFFYQGYLRERPNAPNRALVEKLVDEAQRKLDEQRADEAAQARARAVEGAAGSPKQQLAPAPPVAVSTTPVVPPSPQPAPSPVATSPVIRIAGFATAGAGALLLGGGIYAGLHSESLANQISDISSKQGTWTPQEQSTYGKGQSWATLASVLYVSGAVALATGVALTWFGWPKADTVTASVTPSRGGAAVDLLARF